MPGFHSWGAARASGRLAALAFLPIIGILLAGCGGGGSGTTATPATVRSPVYGLNFSPYTGSNQDPTIAGSAQISSGQITALLGRLKGYTTWVRTFGTQNGLENVAPVARQMGFKTAIGAFIGSDASVNAAQIANLVTAAKAGNVDIAIVGNETLLTASLSEDQLIAAIQSVKAQVPAGVKVTYADTWNTIVAHPRVIAAVDVVAVNIYPFYENKPVNQAVAALQADYAQTVQAANGKQVLITETGWPSSGNPRSFSPSAIPSPANAAAYFAAAENWARTANVPLFYFEAYDEPYKANHGDYPSWGIWDQNGSLKPGDTAAFQ